MKLYKTIFLFMLAGFLIIGSLQAAPQSAFSASEVGNRLPQKCLDVLKPHLEKLGMSLDDINDKDKASQFKERYVNTPQWEKIRSACQTDLSRSSDSCDNCDAFCLGNCACFFTWCYYNCPCK